MSLSRELLRRLPKAELHVHLDGSLRPQTMIELAREQNVRLPADDPAALREAMLVKNARSLEEYLERYTVTLAVMQTPQALERIAYEFVIDSAAENVRYLEVRYCPALHTPALTLAQAVEAPLRGVRRAQAETGTGAALIICGLRTLAPSVSENLAHLAVDYRSEGVVAFDLAGAERGFPARDHARAFAYAAAHGLACTCHAGEANGPDSIRQAIHDCGAQRIGHGTRLDQDPVIEEYVLQHRIPLEMCLSSNLHTRAVTDLSSHPARRYFDRGCVVTLNTDSRLMDGIDLTHEYWLAHTRLGFTREELDRLILNAFESSFLPDAEKWPLVAKVKAELDSII
ncbi:MAG: adenosine deaminase [Gemmatimonadetes bacterium]|nr:adenosine deaminase [Gemmatimonadota bacterium]